MNMVSNGILYFCSLCQNVPVYVKLQPELGASAAVYIELL